MNALQRACAALREQTPVRAEWVATAPGRINLLGEHTDYEGGPVLPVAIDRVCAAVAAPSDTHTGVRVVAADLDDVAVLERSDLIDPADAGALPAWARYVAGVVSGFVGEGATVPSLDMALASDVPLGSGLSSSAALEVSVATMLTEVTGFRPAPLDLARLCQRAEHEWAGVPCGLMDQAVSVLAEPGHALHMECGAGTVRHVPLPPPDVGVIVAVDSGVRHELAAGAYAIRRAWCRDAARALGVPALADAVPDVIDRAHLGADAERAARHVTSETARTRAAVELLSDASRSGAWERALPRLGALMNASHDSLRDGYLVSCAELDRVVDSARAQPGVHGARMTGGGFGGYAVVLAESAAAPALLRVLRARWSAFVVVPSGGARAHRLPC